MRLLFTCPTYPLPLDTGSRVRWVNLAQKLTQLGHTVDVLCFATTEEEARGKCSDNPFGRIEVVRTGPDKPASSLEDKLSRTLAVTIAQLRGLPRFMACAFHPGFRRRLSSLAHEYDAVCVEMFFMAANLERKLLKSNPDKFVLVEHDISFIPFLRQYEVIRQSSDPFAKLRAWWSYNGVYMVERAVLSQFRRIVAMSAIDAALLAKLTPSAEIILTPNGVDTEAVKPRNLPRQGSMDELLYVGGLRHGPNRDAVHHFLSNILPVIDKAVPGMRLTVLGNTDGFDLELAALAPGRVDFPGFVPNAGPYYNRCLALVVPLRVGGGTRLKILEAMGAGVPIITTSIGAEGIDVIHGENALVADTPEEFALATRRLLDDPAYADRLAWSGRVLCETQYDWHSIASQFIKQIDLYSRKVL